MQNDKRHDQSMKTHRALILIFGAAALFAVGCAYYPENARLAHYDGQSGYRFKNLSNTGNSDSLQVFLALSGGGTRAAALSYGVLEELAHTQIVWEGRGGASPRGRENTAATIANTSHAAARSHE
jgi:NTE family protein